MRSTEVVLNTTMLIQQVHDRLQTAQSHQKGYVDRQRSGLKFHFEDFVLLKVSPWKGVIYFRKWAQLDPILIRPLRFIAWVGKFVYRFDHVSQLRKCLGDDSILVPLDEIQVDESLSYMERSVTILDGKIQTLHNKVVGLVKVQWQHWQASE